MSSAGDHHGFIKSNFASYVLIADNISEMRSRAERRLFSAIAQKPPLPEQPPRHRVQLCHDLGIMLVRRGYHRIIERSVDG